MTDCLEWITINDYLLEEYYMKRAVVTGAGGFTKSCLRGVLIKNNKTAAALVRKNSKIEPLKNKLSNWRMIQRTGGYPDE